MAIQIKVPCGDCRGTGDVYEAPYMYQGYCAANQRMVVRDCPSCNGRGFFGWIEDEDEVTPEFNPGVAYSAIGFAGEGKQR